MNSTDWLKITQEDLDEELNEELNFDLVDVEKYPCHWCKLKLRSEYEFIRHHTAHCTIPTILVQRISEEKISARESNQLGSDLLINDDQSQIESKSQSENNDIVISFEDTEKEKEDILYVSSLNEKENDVNILSDESNDSVIFVSDCNETANGNFESVANIEDYLPLFTIESLKNKNSSDPEPIPSGKIYESNENLSTTLQSSQPVNMINSSAQIPTNLIVKKPDGSVVTMTSDDLYNQFNPPSARPFTPYSIYPVNNTILPVQICPQPSQMNNVFLIPANVLQQHIPENNNSPVIIGSPRVVFVEESLSNLISWQNIS